MPTMMTPGWVSHPAQDLDDGPDAGDAVAEFHEATRFTPAAHHRAVRPVRRPSRDQARSAGTLESWHLPALDPVPGLAFLDQWRKPRPTFADQAPVEIYASLRAADGTWTHAHHDQANGRLHRMGEGDAGFAEACAQPEAVRGSAAVLHVTAVPARVGRAVPVQRAYRIALIEAASVLCDLRDVASAAGWSATAHADFFDTRVEIALGLDGFHELYIASLALRTEAAAR